MLPTSIMVIGTPTNDVEISSAFRVNQTVLLQKIAEKYKEVEIEMSSLIDD